MNFPSCLWPIIPPRVRSFLCDGPEIRIDSKLSRETIIEQLRDSFVDRSKWAPVGPYGMTDGDKIRVSWAAGFSKCSWRPVFRGRIESADGGSVIVGRMSHDRMSQAFFAIVSAALVIWGLLFIWTILIPLLAWGALWLLNALIDLGENELEQKRAKIRAQLNAIAQS